MTPTSDRTITHDLDSTDEIAELVNRFYADVRIDSLLGPVFNDVAAVDWDTHLPKLTAFWSRALLGIEGYQGNPFMQHAKIHERSPLTRAHFTRWLSLFEQTLASRWEGPQTERARDLARNVARVHARQLGVTGDADQSPTPPDSSTADPPSTVS